MKWKMTHCWDSFTNRVTEHTFDSPEAWRAWLAEHDPGLLRKGVFVYDTPYRKQYGTDNHWSMLERV